jgi:hypothetical protein
MGFLKDVISNPVRSIALGPVIGGLMGRQDRKEEDKARANANALDLYNMGMADNARATAEKKKTDFYGKTLSGLGGETEDYVGRLKGNLDKNVAKADLFNQQQAVQRGLQNTKAGLSGVDTTAMNEQSRRNASFGAAAINEDAQRNALDLYGTSISNRIEGANKIDNSEMALAIAQMKQPETNYKPGLIGSIFGGFLS